MPDEPTPDVKTREATLPDGTRMVIAVKAALPQEDVDLLAATLWQEIPEG